MTRKKKKPLRYAPAPCAIYDQPKMRFCVVDFVDPEPFVARPRVEGTERRRLCDAEKVADRMNRDAA